MIGKTFKINMLVWNIRGMDSSIIRLKKLIQANRVELLCIIVPKHLVVQCDSYSKILNSKHYMHSVTGHIWLFWNSSLTISLIKDRTQFLSVNIHSQILNSYMERVFVYGLRTLTGKKNLWKDLISLNLQNAVYIGDYNAYRSINEYKGISSPGISSINDFNDFVQTLTLDDIHTVGNLFTWTNGRINPTIERLDRGLCSPQWSLNFPSSAILVLNRDTSDHCPLLLTVGSKIPSTPRPFRFISTWFKRTDFMEVIKSSWELPLDVSGMIGLFLKLNRLKKSIMVWNKEVFGNIENNVKIAEENLRKQEINYDLDQSEGEISILLDCKSILNQALKEENHFWKQKEKIKWLKDGDENTAYFHNSVKERKGRLGINKMKEVHLYP